MTKIKLNSIKETQAKEDALFVSGDVGGGDESEDEVEAPDDTSHARLLADIKKMSKSKRSEAKTAVRTCLGSGAGVTGADTSRLISRLQSSHLKQTAPKIEACAPPVEKIIARKAKRAAGYENVMIESEKWARLVHRQRRADTVHFPLQQPDLRPMEVWRVEERDRRPKTKLEEEVYTLLHGAKLVEKKLETEEERIVKRALSLQEIREKNRELWHQKEMMRRYEYKAMMQNKSKSRKHHQLLRREKMKKKREELEELQRTDPEAALEILHELERARVEERMSLRHKRSKWAHLQGPRAIRDKQVMAALKENQRLHRELTVKANKKKDSDEEDTAQEITEKLKEKALAIEEGSYDPMNPWTNHLERPQGNATELGEEEEEAQAEGSYTKFVKFWNEFNRRKDVDRKIQEEMERREVEEEEMREKAKTNLKEKEVEEETRENEGEEGKTHGKKKTKKAIRNETKKNTNLEKVSTKKKQKKLTNKLSSQTDPVTISQNKPEETTPEIIPQVDPDDDHTTSTSIDALFDEAEEGIKTTIKRKMEKLGIKEKEEETWREVKRQKKKASKKNQKTERPIVVEEYDFTSTHNFENIDERPYRDGPPDADETINDGKSELENAVTTLNKNPDDDNTDKNKSQKNKAMKKKENVDPTKFMQVKTKRLITEMPNNMGAGEEWLDDQEEEGEREQEDPEAVIREAFADDYLIEEFTLEKAEAMKRDNPKIMSLAIPGWGDWTGPNIKIPRKKFNKYKVKNPKRVRKDSNLGNVIYNEDADLHDKLRKAMVSDLPYHFKSVRDFEASVRAPIGRMFVPEGAYRRLTQPSLVTKLGAVIEPMTEDELLKKKKGERDGDGRGRGRGRGGGGRGRGRGRGRGGYGRGRGGRKGDM